MNGDASICVCGSYMKIIFLFHTLYWNVDTCPWKLKLKLMMAKMDK